MTPVTRKACPRTGRLCKVQLRKHVRAAFASQTVGPTGMGHPFAIPFHIKLAMIGDQAAREYQTQVADDTRHPRGVSVRVGRGPMLLARPTGSCKRQQRQISVPSSTSGLWGCRSSQRPVQLPRRPGRSGWAKGRARRAKGGPRGASRRSHWAVGRQWAASASDRPGSQSPGGGGKPAASGLAWSGMRSMAARDLQRST